MKILKILGVAFAAILLLVLAGVGYLTSQFDAARLKSEAAKVMQEKYRRTLKIDGDIKLSFWPNLGVSVAGVTLSEHQSDQAFAAIEGARVSMAVLPLLSRQLVVNNIQLNGLQATIIKHKDGVLNIADLLGDQQSGRALVEPGAGEPVQASGDKPLLLDIAGVNFTEVALGWHDEQSGSSTTISGLDLSTGRIQADSASKTYLVSKLVLDMQGRYDGKSGSENIEVKLEVPRFSIAQQASRAESLTLSAVLSGAQRKGTAKLTLSGIDGNGKVLQIGKLALDLDATVNSAAVKGRLGSAVSADLGKQTLSLDKIDGSLDISHPQLPLKQLRLPLAGTAHADFARQAVDGRLQTQFDESKIALKFGVAKFSPLAASFDLDIDRINLDKYLPAKVDEPTSAAKAAERPVAASPALDFSALRDLNLIGALAVGQLQVRHVKIADLRLQLHAASGRLAVAPLSATLYAGKLAGALSINANDQSVTLRQNLAGISIGPLLKDVMARDMLDGQGSVALDLRAHGKTMAEMKQTLAGSASLALKDGAIKGINLAQNFRDLKAKLGARQDQILQNKTADRTDFSELTASFKIADGIAHNDDLVAKSPFLRLAGAGDLDIAASRLNYLLKASVVASAGGQGGSDLAHLKGVTVPVRLTGAFDNPAWRIEVAGLVGEAARAKVEETRQKAQERVKDKLKALLAK